MAALVLASEAALLLRPPMVTSPSWSRWNSMISSSVVVLPQPDSPTIEKHSPSRMSKLRPSTALTVPIRRLIRAPFISGKCFLTSLSSRTALRSARGTASNRETGTSGAWKISWTSTSAPRDSVLMQAALCSSVPSPLPLTGQSSGSPCRQASLTSGQRGAKEHPVGAWMRFGGMPSIGTSEVFSATSTRGTAPSRPMV